MPASSCRSFAFCSSRKCEPAAADHPASRNELAHLENIRDPSEIHAGDDGRLPRHAGARLSGRAGDTCMISKIKTLFAGAFVAALASPALAQAPAPWALSNDLGYAYHADGKLLTYKMGTSNAKLLFKGARKVPKNTLFFIGENGQLYMRTGPFLEDDGRFKFGPG
jgi:hypothetical protein